MRAAVLRAPGAPLAIEDVHLDPPRRGELRVRIEAAGVCHTDYHYMTGDMTCPLPIVLGHEGAGVVEEVGPGSAGRVHVGERVALLWRPHCGRCAMCVRGNPAMCELGRVQATTGGLPDGTSRLSEDGATVHHFLGVSCFAEHVVVSEDAVVPVPDGVPPAIAAIAGCAVITGAGAALNAVPDPAGTALVVVGAGGVGLAAVMGARLRAAEPVIVLDVDPGKFELARRVGADVTLDARDPAVVEAVLALAPSGVPAVIDAVGRPETIERSFAMLAPTGTLAVVGLTRADARVALPVNELVQRQKRVVGALYGASNPFVDLPRIFALYLAGRLPLDELLGATRPLEDVNDTYAELARGSVGRTILVP